MRIPLSEYPARRIALIKPSALGDIVQSLPVLGALRHRYPTAHITWVINRSYAPLVEGHPELDAVLPFDRSASGRGWLRRAWGFYRFLRQIHELCFDLVIDLQGLLRTGLMVAASGACRKVGLASAREGARWFYTDTLYPPIPPLSKGGRGGVDMHAVDRYWLVAEALGAGYSPKRFSLPLNPAEQSWADEKLTPQPRPWLMISVGTRWQTKRWPVGHFAALARRALDVFGGTVIAVGGPEETTAAQELTARLGGGVLNLAGATSLRQLVAVLARADLMISNDSGPLHVAAALGRPVVAPYTCTSPMRTGPYGQREGAVATQVWCAASYLKRCDRMDCMKELTPERLWPATEAALKEWQRRTA